MLPATRHEVISLLFFGALLALGLHYLADFSLRQTAALILLLGFIYVPLNDVLKAIWQDRHPTRFSVFIRPKWREILFDHGLVRNEQEWHQWLERIKTAPASEQSLLRDGFHFTVLQQDRDLRSQFIFVNDSNSFVSELEVSRLIPGIEIERPGSPLGWIKVVWIPSFIIRHPTWGGYELSLTTPPPDLSEEQPITFASLFKLAFLTVLEFSGHEIRPRGWIESRAYQEQQQARRKSLEENGWTRVEKEYQKFSHIEHKYFTVTHGSI